MDTLSAQYRNSALAAKRRYLAKTRCAKQIQIDLLEQILAANQHAAFGKEHGFANVTSPQSYARAVPVRGYQELLPWIEREAAGSRQTLTTDPPIVFHRTSSTTSAPKKIPMTRSGALVCFANSGAHRASLLEHHPEVVEAVDATLALTISRPVDTTIYGGIPWCFISETNWAALGFPRHPGTPGARTPWARWPTDIDDWPYYRLRMAIESPLRAILSWFPASVLYLETCMCERAEQLIADVRNGAVCGKAMLAPNANRARELEVILRDPPPWPLTRIWPTLSVVECWTTATSGLYLDHLQTCVGEGVEVFPCGYASTESPIAFTFERNRGTLLDVTAAFFEFLPVDANESDATALCCELEQGKDYSIVLTTMSGLYRYAIGDIVRVLETVNEVPVVEFRSRQGVAASLIGERMTEEQVVVAFNELRRAAGIGAFEAALCPMYSTPPHYVLAVDSQAHIDKSVASRLSELLDEQFKGNVRYAYYRQTGLVGIPQIELLSPGTFAARRAETRGRQWARLPQQKHPVVISGDELDALRSTSRRI